MDTQNVLESKHSRKDYITCACLGQVIVRTASLLYTTQLHCTATGTLSLDLLKGQGVP